MRDGDFILLASMLISACILSKSCILCRQRDSGSVHVSMNDGPGRMLEYAHWHLTLIVFTSCCFSCGCGVASVCVCRVCCGVCCGCVVASADVLDCWAVVVCCACGDCAVALVRVLPEDACGACRGSAGHAVL